MAGAEFDIASVPVLENYWTGRRKELLAWFVRHSPSLGELYQGALWMIFTPNFPGRVRLVAHAVREIRNRLPDVIAGTKTGGTFQWKNALDRLAKDWQKAGFSLDGTIPTSFTGGQTMPSNEISIKPQLFRKISKVLKGHVESREKREEAAIRLFEGLAPDNQNVRETLRPVVLRWLDVTEWFVEKAHDSGVCDKGVDGTEFIRRFELFETTLAALIRGFFKTVEGLDEILEDANT